MRLRDAEQVARRFVAAHHPECAAWNFDIELEHDGERRKSWSFGVRPDDDDPDRETADHDPDRGLVGYVHANGTVEGMY